MSATTPFRLIVNSAKSGTKALSIQATRPISTHTYKGKAPYKTGSKEQQEVIDTAYDGATNLGFDSHGASNGEIAGGFHDRKRGGGPADEQWITVQFTDSQKRVLYHKKKDGTEWDRIHLYKDPKLNQAENEKPVTIYTKK